MKQIKLIENIKQANYTQISQDTKVTFSFIKRTSNKGEFRELFPRVLCRDYLSDCVMSSNVKGGDGKVSGIYGFKLNEKIDTGDCLLSVQVNNPAKFKKCVRLIRDLERNIPSIKNKFTLLATQNENVFIILADKYWISNSLTISTLTFIFRLMLNLQGLSDDRTFYTIESLYKHFSKKIDSSTGEVRGDLGYLKKIRFLDMRLILRDMEFITKQFPIVGVAGFDPTPSDFIGSGILHSLHNDSGILSFARNIQGLTDNRVVNPFGLDWCLKYIELEGNLKVYSVNGVSLMSECVSGEGWLIKNLKPKGEGVYCKYKGLEVRYE